jgi:hypothetical protein
VEEETFPDIGSMSDEELKALHGQIDIFRAELVNRLRENRPERETLIKGDDVERLSEILSGRGESPTKPPT